MINICAAGVLLAPPFYLEMLRVRLGADALAEFPVLGSRSLLKCSDGNSNLLFLPLLAQVHSAVPTAMIQS